MQKHKRHLVKFGRGPTWLVILTGGCTPLSVPPPFHFTETAQVMKRWQGSASVAVGGGGFDDTGGSALGAGARGRLGVGASQEVGVELVAIGKLGDEGNATPERPWNGESGATLGKVSWKLGATPWLAVLVGLGGSSSEMGGAVGADGAFIASTPERVWQVLVPYVGVRGAYALPEGRDRDEGGGPTQATVLAGGTSVDLGRKLRLFGELAWTNEWNRGFLSTDADPARVIESKHHGGGYFALGLTYLFGGDDDPSQ